MALIVSAASGNFNAGATWVGGVVPTVGDEAQAATGHTITITANTTCDLLSNTGTGNFTLNAGVTLNANVTNKSTTSNRTCLQFTAANPATASINGNCTGGSIVGGSVAASNTSSGTLQINGNCTGGTSNGGNCHGATNTANGTINVIGNCTGGSVAGANHFGVNNASNGTINITGNCAGGSGSGTSSGSNNASSGTINITGNCSGSGSSGTHIGTQNASTGTINITGNISGGSIAGAVGVNNSSTGSVIITGNATANIAAAVNQGSAGLVNIVGTLQAHQSSPAVVGANVLQTTILSGPFLTETVRGVSAVYCAAWRWNASVSNSTYMEVMTNNLLAKRNLVTDNNVTGMPAVTNVRSGTVYGPTNSLTGTLVVPSANSVSFGVPVDNTTGTAILTGAAVEAAVWGAATRTITGGTVDTLTNAPSVPSASAIASQVRTELSVELGRVDAAISTRATPANIPTADIAAIKVKTDALNTTRLAQVSTTEIVGNLLAQANS